MFVYELEVEVPYESSGYHETLMHINQFSNDEFNSIVEVALQGRKLSDFGVMNSVIESLVLNHGFIKIKPVVFAYTDGEWAED
ncbi:hypothetical protein [Brevibacillus laterosporus]|uniref:hypothetical protein n=1 Tax=Brevibacillus laterosporus TaxID=1465 RepID=UPI00215D1AED|nr:hypothetical protein [Brevibacillus laterosporus]MCR8994596.1 hypothetical protein [Brevibacillus laterosporus]